MLALCLPRLNAALRKNRVSFPPFPLALPFPPLVSWQRSDLKTRGKRGQDTPFLPLCGYVAPPRGRLSETEVFRAVLVPFSARQGTSLAVLRSVRQSAPVFVFCPCVPPSSAVAPPLFVCCPRITAAPVRVRQFRASGGYLSYLII